ncbi:hypothetical protein [Polyangium jinanense]|uniref:Uncharacterized protein n=1 Tax=Polyangium jinanense TaxID=2829994 RepID=A0A9X3XHF0_9BACT|nr:hypothetical protein [Polyangium jinanense]MDC3959155.1 hypothetical protein [Polyangium jinanense]MDC3989460.1 hypothetical protein [Polyangium jinanense]
MPRPLRLLLVLAVILLAATSAQAAEPLVIQVIVPLCSNAQIDCGSNVAGDPDRLDTNLYWGAAFGHRRYFDRKKSGFTRVDVVPADGPRLERVVYRRLVSAEPFGGKRGETLEQIVVLDAYHGDSIDRAVEAFWHLATRGGRIRFHDGGKEREARISVAGYAGHNRLMDGVRLPPTPGPEERGRAIPSFVLACDSEPYFGPALRAAGSETWLMTRSLMAPEGYVLDAVVNAIGVHAPPSTIRDRAVDAYAKWQKLSRRAAGSIFAKPR